MSPVEDDALVEHAVDELEQRDLLCGGGVERHAHRRLLDEVVRRPRTGELERDAERECSRASRDDLSGRVVAAPTR